MKRTVRLFFLISVFAQLSSGMVCAVDLGIGPDGNVVPFINLSPPSDTREVERMEADKRKAAAIEKQTKEMKRQRETWEKEMAERRRERAFDQARSERKAYVRRIRGK